MTLILGRIVLSAYLVAVGDFGPRSRHRPDCGLQSLYVLLSVKGIHIDLDSLLVERRHVPGEGTSLFTLRRLAARHGLLLDGVRIRRRNASLDRPSIVHLARGQHGHFVFMRPMDRERIQIIDSADGVYTIAVGDLSSIRGWTGYALVPHRPRRLFLAFLWLTMPVALLIITLVMLRRRETRGLWLGHWLGTRSASNA